MRSKRNGRGSEAASDLYFFKPSGIADETADTLECAGDLEVVAAVDLAFARRHLRQQGARHGDAENTHSLERERQAVCTGRRPQLQPGRAHLFEDDALASIRLSRRKNASVEFAMPEFLLLFGCECDFEWLGWAGAR